jgi:glycine/D-amino acid oxidase-like deaminating enzyme
MIAQPTIDFLIVGQGLAGTIISKEIKDRGYSFRIIDDNHKSSGSMAAGGIMHPMSFKRLIESWRSLEFIDYAKDYYNGLQESFKSNFFEEFNLLRPFGSIEEQNDWMAKMKLDEFRDWMGIEDERVEGISHPFGVGSIKEAGKLNVPEFLLMFRNHFINEIVNEKFDFSDLQLSDGKASYSGQLYHKVIFCEGFQYINNPYFGYLPNNVTKGEILEIESFSMDRKMITKGCFIVPNEKPNQFTVGSTYVWDSTDESLTDEGRIELVEKVNKTGLKDYEIVSQKCGIRPTTHDRRPLVGNHPIHANLWIFNGMGSKTVMMAPLLAKQLLDEIEQKGKVFEDANIKRLEKKHFHKYLASYERTKV